MNKLSAKKPKYITFFLKSTISLFLALLVAGEFTSHTCAKKETSSNELSVSAQSAILMTGDSNQILYSKNHTKERPMASTTKIMTALLALEAAQKEDINVTITNKMVPVEGSSMYLKVGDVLSLKSLAKGMLVVSGNDAANSTAIAMGGSIEGFADIMNNKAKQIGMKQTHFATPSGLDSQNKDHYSTAYDMSILGSYAMKNKEFFDIVSQKKMATPLIIPHETRMLRNHNRLLKRYDGCVGIKTGYTKRAGRCLVSCAERNGVRLIVTTLNAGDDWNDHAKLYDYGFSQVESANLEIIQPILVPVVGGDVNEITAIQKASESVTLKKVEKADIKTVVEVPRFIYAPLEKGQIIGKVYYKLGEITIASSDITVAESVNAQTPPKSWFKKLFEFFRN